MSEADPSRCPLCRGDNACAIVAADGDPAAASSCWCSATSIPAEVLAAVPAADRDRACVCAACASGESLPDGVSYTTDAGGRGAVALRADGQVAVVSFTGAQVLEWRLVDGRDALWTASEPVYEHGAAVRGGVPVVFPWFGAHRDDPGKPAHGFARSARWRCTAADATPSVTLSLEDDDATRALWPHAFRVDLTVALRAEGLELALVVHNRGDAPFTFEEALHTYFAVGDVREASVHGLEGVPFVEHAREPEPSWDSAAPLRFRAETDRVFSGVPDRIELRAPSLDRVVNLDAREARSAIVWNPWPNKTARLSQMRGDDWIGFCCIETANVHDRARTLEPGARHELRLRLTAVSD